jgi:hypothetical protein
MSDLATMGSSFTSKTNIQSSVVDPPADSTPATFSDALRSLRDRVTRTLTDATRNNPLVYYRDSRTTRFTLPPYGWEVFRKLIEGRSLRRADLADVMPPAAAVSGAAAAPMGETLVANGAAPGKGRRLPWTRGLMA